MTASSIMLLLDSASPGTYPMKPVLPRRSRRPRVRLLHPEADLHRDLIVGDLAAVEMAADLRDLEPVEVAQRGVGPRHAAVDRLLDALRGRSGDLDDPVGGVAHGHRSSSLWAVTPAQERTPLRVELRSAARARRSAKETPWPRWSSRSTTCKSG